MVKICSLQYPIENEANFQKYYNKYSYSLHNFQKWSIEAIVEGNHLLVCAPTGSGKTMPGEFAIDYFFSKGKKTIYTTPIKALSNEKFFHFTNKYPHVSIGLITGDIKTNPDADVLIMTTEILLNLLLREKPVLNNSFEIDIENELGCIVFDEIHMINDENRGHVWEQCIMLLPKQVQMIGLSATLDNPEKFAVWLETNSNDKLCYLTTQRERNVPLIHYTFITVPNGINKVIKDKATQEEIKRNINKPFVILDEKGKFNELSYANTTKILKMFDKHNIRVKRKHVLNQLSEYLVEKEMLPALCYVFSRKQLEICAEELTTNLLEFDSKIPYIIDRECLQIIRKLPNYEEYLYLPEYLNLVKLLRKGVGIHHAGLMPILREMV
jgi:superfamily II RNA helicase